MSKVLSLKGVRPKHERGLGMGRQGLKNGSGRVSVNSSQRKKRGENNRNVCFQSRLTRGRILSTTLRNAWTRERKAEGKKEPARRRGNVVSTSTSAIATNIGKNAAFFPRKDGEPSRKLGKSGVDRLTPHQRVTRKNQPPNRAANQTSATKTRSKETIRSYCKRGRHIRASDKVPGFHGGGFQNSGGTGSYMASGCGNRRKWGKEMVGRLVGNRDFAAKLVDQFTSGEESWKNRIKSLQGSEISVGGR